jgi:hypothetical protein
MQGFEGLPLTPVLAGARASVHVRDAFTEKKAFGVRKRQVRMAIWSETNKCVSKALSTSIRTADVL